MNTNAGLRFIALILVMLGAAVAVRAFEINKRSNATKPFTLTIASRAKLTSAAVKDFEKTLASHSPEYDVCFRKDPNAQDQSLHAGGGKPTTCEAKSGQPHIQQTIAFDTVTNMKAVVDLLTTRATKPVSSPAPETSASPAPHVSQQVESHTPQAAKAIAAALGR